MQEPSSIEKVAEIDTHIGAAMSGLTPDARTLIEHARGQTQARLATQHFQDYSCNMMSLALAFHPDCVVHVQNHRFTYNEAMPVESCVQSLCDLALRFGEDDKEDDGGASMVHPSANYRFSLCGADT